MKPTEMQRFARRIRFEQNGCWRWLGALNTKGYGRFAESGRPNAYAHRFSFQRFVGPIPGGLVVDHLCRNRWCANPGHMELVTSAENIARGDKPGRKRKTHCRYGHAFTPENTRFNRTRRWMQQVCLACERRRWSKDKRLKRNRRDGH